MTGSQSRSKISLRLGSAGVVPIAIAAAVIFGYYFISGAVFASLISNTTIADLLVNLRLNRLMLSLIHI